MSSGSCRILLANPEEPVQTEGGHPEALVGDRLPLLQNDASTVDGVAGDPRECG